MSDVEVIVLIVCLLVWAVRQPDKRAEEFADIVARIDIEEAIRVDRARAALEATDE